MGTQSKRPGRAAREVHEAIRADADALKQSGRIRMRDASEFPELSALLYACRDAVTAGIPRFVHFKGRNYWLRVRLSTELDVFAEPGDAAPLVRGMNYSNDEHGHAPGH